MINDTAKANRPLKKAVLQADLVVIGGGMAGTCCAITAARKGIKVILVQDRPVLGGNASSEVRLWILGATSHMGNNNRWAREGGVIDELLVENMYRNPDGNTLIFDTILLEKVNEEKNITLLLNTAVYDTQKAAPNRITEVRAFCSQNSIQYVLKAPLFCDASGDGIVGFQSGAAFRMGAEPAEEFDEPFAPSKAYGELLGHSMYFMSKDVGKPVKYVAPAYALKDITKIPRYRKFNIEEHGCWLWWIEWGGRLDTVHDTETIKWELWKVIYGVWNYIKNSGQFPEAATMTLEWVGQIPGKRESRRFEGHYMLKQSDIVQQVHFEDAVAHGGWAIDLHPADGIFSEKPGCNQWHSKGVYEIPYRCMVSKNIDNLFLAGRIISASHVAFGSTRVMATCAHSAQAIGMAAALGIQNDWSPADLMESDRMQLLQQELLKTGQYIPHLALQHKDDLLQKIRSYSIKKSSVAITTSKSALLSHPLPDDLADEMPIVNELMVSSELKLREIPFDGPWMPLNFSSAQLLPLNIGTVPKFEIEVSAQQPCELTISLRKSAKAYNYTPDITLATQHYRLNKGEQRITIPFDVELEEATYVFLCFHQNEFVSIRGSQARITGLVSVFNKQNKAVSNYGRQEPDPGIGFEAFEFWVPIRRPAGHNFAMSISPGLTCFGAKNLTNGFFRPYLRPNAWVASMDEERPELHLQWATPQIIRTIVLSFDTDWDYAMESSLLGHAESVMPFTVKEYQVLDKRGELLYEVQDNHQTRNELHFEEPVKTDKLTVRLKKPSDHVPVGLFGINCY